MKTKRPRRDAPRISPALARLVMPIRSLWNDETNVRRHPERNIEAIKASLRAFGQQAPVIYVIRGGRRVVIKGNGVLAAARALGWKRLAALPSRLAGQDARAFAIADNRTTDLSGFDEGLLAAQLQELEETEFDVSAAGFNEDELQELLDRVEEPPGRPIGGGAASRHRAERRTLFVAGHLTFEVPRRQFERWLSGLEAKVGEDPDRLVAEIKRRLAIELNERFCDLTRRRSAEAIHGRGCDWAKLTPRQGRR